jgi:hypothetical protein
VTKYGFSVVQTDVVEDDHVRVVDRADEPGFPLEPLDERPVGAQASSVPRALQQLSCIEPVDGWAFRTPSSSGQGTGRSRRSR